MYLATFLAAIAGSLAKQVLAAIGVGVITYVGFSAIQTQISQAIQGQINSLSSSLYQIMAMSGFIDAIGIWLGALTTVASLIALKKLGVVST